MTAHAPPPLPEEDRKSLAAAGLALHFDTVALVGDVPEIFKDCDVEYWSDRP